MKKLEDLAQKISTMSFDDVEKFRVEVSLSRASRDAKTFLYRELDNRFKIVNQQDRLIVQSEGDFE